MHASQVKMPTYPKKASHTLGQTSTPLPVPISLLLGPSQKRCRSPSPPPQPNTTTFSRDKVVSEIIKLDVETLIARLEDAKHEIDTLHTNGEDRDQVIAELQELLGAAETEIAILQIGAEDAEAMQAKDRAQIKMILDHLGM
ncbi:hypothetical protein Tco_1483096 [Tanacetum coccineum]